MKIGNAKRSLFNRDVSPGPGDYNTDIGRKSPQLSFTKAQKSKAAVQETPGPDYTAPSSLPKVVKQ